jgi:hypothetical protein
MWFPSVFALWLSRARDTRRASQAGFRRRSRRLTIDQLEDRTAPATFTAATVPDLVAAINAANLQGGDNTIMLTPSTAFVLTAPDNTTDGATGLPVIASKDHLTIQGNSDTLARSSRPVQ